MKQDRRSFLISSFILSSFAFAPKSLNSFELQHSSFQLSKRQIKVISKIQNHLFPKGENNPSSSEIKADVFLQKVLLDEDYDKDIRIGIYENIERITKQSKSKFSRNILDLNESEMEELLLNVKNTWGESFLSILLLFIIEALFSDPIYGHNKGNIKGGGFEWIGHIPGYPSANESNKYGAL
jgi:gluconate 2-dehydrogenase gamma chain